MGNSPILFPTVILVLTNFSVATANKNTHNFVCNNLTSYADLVLDPFFILHSVIRSIHGSA